jgi:protein-S-isoprenylcysteine O-methyltransferase
LLLDSLALPASNFVVHDTSYTTKLFKRDGKLTSVESIRNASSYVWLALCIVWSLLSFSTKRTVQKQSAQSRIWYVALLILGCFFIFYKGTINNWLDTRLVPLTPPAAWAGFVIVCFGIAFSIWARLVLGPNWSGVVTIKEGHTLIRRGPYRIVQHPIYTGILLGMFGSAVQYGLLRSFLGVVLIAVGFSLKSRTEELFMVQQFGEQYLRYREQVRALVPFVF